ncbi:NAD(P)-dependent oxidoreductase [Alkalimarinus coralli]|uniref:NAD(P)-dependent oxidoreductase n=1 Tax=Alkalimarinus coralli TaxID=2935863 RepID=UPI00202BA451|nr:NAD(P)-dependent oxidoreductase [Alkalimarinus coralli]
MNILNLDPYCYSEKARQALASFGNVEEIVYSRPQLMERLHSVEVLILRFSHRIDREVMDCAPMLKVIATNATGTDHIDLEYANKKGIKVISLKGEYEFLRNIHATAELTWGLILAGIRKIPTAFDSVKHREWDRNRFLGNELFGQRLGIVGLGRIGEKVANYGQAFGMEVIAHDIVPEKALKYPFVTMCSSLSECIENSDILSIHVPLDDATNKLIGRNEISLMKQKSFLVNTSRGAIVDGEALLDALITNRIAGAAMDVLEGEGVKDFVQENSLIHYASDNDNLLITPHIGGVTLQSWEKTELFIAEKVKQYLQYE